MAIRLARGFGFALATMLWGCIGTLPPEPKPMLPADYAFDNPQAVVVYGRIATEQNGAIYLINQAIENVHYPLKGGESGFFVLEIEPGHYLVKRARKSVRFSRKGFKAEGYQAMDRMDEVLVEEAGVVAAGFIGKPGDVLYIGNIYKRMEFIESQDDKAGADPWMAKRYPAFPAARALKYLAK